jgi:hypothetical protein
MIDTVKGQSRARKWPRKRAARRTSEQLEAEQQFRAAQAAAKYMDPKMVRSIQDAVQGTALYPRDIITSMLYGRFISFLLPNGIKLMTTQSRNQVSESLDALSQIPGSTLVRGADFWEAQIGLNGPQLRIIADQEITSATQWWESPEIIDTTMLMIIARNLTASASGQRFMQARNATNGQWLTTSGDYQNFDAAGVTSNTIGLFPHTTSTTAGRTVMALVFGAGLIANQPFIELTRSRTGLIASNARPIDRIRIGSGTGAGPNANLTGGRITIIGA